MLIETFSLTKRYGRKTVLEDVSFGMNAGEVVGLIGPNGAGKSTLIKLISGLIYPTSGKVMVDGYDVHSQHKIAFRKFGAIIEWPSFYADLTARQNLDLLSGGSGAAYQARLQEVITLVGMERHLNSKVNTFSTGMKQRLGIALALLPDSQVIILDEPTNGLDPGGILEIREIIREFNRRYGTTVLVSSHLLGEIEQICDKIALIADGHLVAFGTLQDLLGGASEVKLAVNDPVLARSILEKEDAFRGRWSERGEYWYFEDGNDALASEINRCLVTQGVAVKHLSVEQKDLEAFFLEKVRKSN